MLKPTDKLREDHKRLVQVLFKLDQEIQNSHHKDWYAPSTVDRILEALAYIQGYPERWHHPMEDLAFSKLLERDAPHSLVIERLMNDHEVLEEQTADLHDRYEYCLNNESAPGAELLKSTYQYLNRQLNHQKRENETAFPLLSSFLTEENWAEIERDLIQVPRREQLQTYYSAVFNRIVHRESIPGLR